VGARGHRPHQQLLRDLSVRGRHQDFRRVPQAEQAAIDAIFGGQSGKQFKRRNTGDHPPAIEIYRSRRYFAVTGDSISTGDDLRVVSLDDLRWLLTGAGPKFAGETKGESKPNGKDESRSARAFRAGAALRAAGGTYDEMRSALLESKDPEIAEWARTKGLANDERELRRIFDKAGDDEPAVRLEDFVAYMQSHAYIFMPSGDFWPGSRVDARLPPVKLVARNGQPILDPKTGEQKQMPASAWLAKQAPIEQITWAPGLPRIVRHQLTREGGWFERKNATVLNLYRPPCVSSSATPQGRSRGSRMSGRSTPTTPTISSRSSRTGCSGRRKRSTTRWS
jgi:hypothetical protein